METHSAVQPSYRPNHEPARAPQPDHEGPRPFLATPVSAPPPSRRILLITYHFPPSGLVGGKW